MKLRVEKFAADEEYVKRYPEFPFTYEVLYSHDGEEWYSLSGRSWCDLDGAMSEIEEYKNPPVGEVVYEEELA